MPYTYTNRKGITYTLYRKIGVDGKLHYVFGRNVVGEPVDALPPGFRVSESPNGIVSVARDRPTQILPQEIAAVEAAIERSRHPRSFRVAAKPNQIEIYGRADLSISVVYEDMLADGLALSEHEQGSLELDDLWAQFTPVAHLTLLDPVTRTFGAEHLTTRWGFQVWRDVGQTGSVAELASVLVPALGADALDAFQRYYATVTAARSYAPLDGGLVPMSTRKRTRSQATSIHQLKVTLLDIEPPIWRRIAVPSDMTLGELHVVLQIAMGWTDSHLHDFRIGNTTYGDPEMLQELGDADEWDAPLAVVAPKTKSRMRYMYDFGDSWEHEIRVEKVGPPEAGMGYPVVLAGERAGPPDDCGGVWGYVDLLEALADPDHPEHDDMMEWTGGPIDPEAFDLEAVNKQLARMR